jgi:hypothetical protein
VSNESSGISRFVIYFLAANLIGGFFLWLAARELPFEEVLPYFREADLGHLGLWCGAFVLVYIVCHGARVFRWYYLVEPLGEVEPATVHRVCAVGFTAILLLPLRLGELVRPYLLSLRTKLPMSGILGTAVVERVIDGLLMTGLLFLTLSLYEGGRATAFARTTGIIAAGIFIPALVVCLLALWRRDWTLSVLRAIGNPISEGLTEKATALLEDFIEGFRALVEARHMGRFLWMTVLYWSTNIISLWVLAKYGFELDIGLWEMATVLPILVMGIMIPAGPALAGNFEYFMIKGMGLFLATSAAGVGTRVAVFAATVHVLQFVVIALPGFFIMWVDPEARHLIQLSRQAEEAVPEEGAS